MPLGQLQQTLAYSLLHTHSWNVEQVSTFGKESWEYELEHPYLVFQDILHGQIDLHGAMQGPMNLADL